MEKKGMNKFTAKVAKFVLKYRLLIILLNILILGALFMGMMKRVGEFGEHVAYMQNLRNNPLEVDSNHVAPPPIMDFDYHVFFEDFTEVTVVKKTAKLFADSPSIKHIRDTATRMPKVTF